MGFIEIPEPVFAAIMKSGIVIIAALVINSLLRSLVKVPRQLDNRRGRTYKVVIKNAITLIVVFLVLYILFKIWNIDIAPLLASAGIIGIVVGIGSRSLFEDLLAGMFLVSQSRVAVGDYISIGNGVEGTVDSIGLKNTTLISGNGAYTVVPNGQIKQVTNNAYGKAQVVLEIPVKTGQPLDAVLRTIGDVIASFDDDQEFKLLKGTKIIGVNKIDVHGAFVVNVLLVAEGRLRGAIEPQFYYRLIKAFEKKKLSFV